MRRRTTHCEALPWALSRRSDRSDSCHDDREKIKKRRFCFSPPMRRRTTRYPARTGLRLSRNERADLRGQMQPIFRRAQTDVSLGGVALTTKNNFARQVERQLELRVDLQRRFRQSIRRLAQ